MKRAPAAEQAESETESPGLPGLRSWRAVYFFVLGCFVFFVLVLAIFSRVFS